MGEWRQIHAFLTSPPDECEWSAPDPGRFTPRKNADINEIRGWLDPSLNCLEKKSLGSVRI
jgi:hypothetical protein